MREIKYINFKCTTPARIRVYEKLRKMAEDKGVDMTSLAIMILDEATKEYNDWYESQCRKEREE